MPISEDDVARYREEGWCSPIQVLSEGEARAMTRELEAAEARFPGEFNASNRNNAHLVLPFLARLALDERIVDAVAAIVGDDLCLWSSVLFIKEPGSGHYVSWHQDATYMGLAPCNFVTAWVALTPSTDESGCVAVIPGSHRDGLRQHQDTFEEANILTRGQQVAGVDEAAAVNLALRPGQMSLHHPWLVHGSRPNRSGARRIGVALQSYLGRDVRPVRGEHHVMPVRGAAPDPAFVTCSPPTGICSADGLRARAAANAAFADVLYAGARARRSL